MSDTIPHEFPPYDFQPKTPKPEPPKQQSRTGLIIVIVILAVALVAVSVFAYTMTRGNHDAEVSDEASVTTTSAPPPTTTPTQTPTPTPTPTVSLNGLACEGADNTWLLSLCGGGDDSLDSVAVSGNGTIYAAGTTTSTDGSFGGLPGDKQSYLAIFDDKTATTIHFDAGNVADIAQTPDGGIVTAGDAGDNHSATLAKYDVEGNLAWQDHYSTKGTFSSFSGIAVNPDGTIVALGQTSPVKKGVIGDPSESFVAKYSASGKRLWTTHHRLLTMRLNGLPTQIAVNAKGTMAVAGAQYKNTDHPKPGMTVAMSLTMTSKADEQYLLMMGGSTAPDAYYDVTATTASNFMAVGQFCSEDSNYSPFGHCTGVMIEVPVKPGVPPAGCWYESDYPTSINSVALTPTGDYVIAGSIDQSGTDALIALVSPPTQTNQPCSVIWSESFGGNGDDSFQDVTVAPNGDIVAVGQSNSTDGDLLPSMGGNDAFIIKLTGDGDTILR